jgi:hypothetical protein
MNDNRKAFWIGFVIGTIWGAGIITSLFIFKRLLD